MAISTRQKLIRLFPCFIRFLRILRANLVKIYYGNPSKKIKLIGITGTNGKTTTATSLYNLSNMLNHKAGLISTINIKVENKVFATGVTTPSSVNLNKYLAKMVKEGCEYCFMEVSSISIYQERIHGLHFYGGVFSNLTHDHLDEHHFDRVKGQKNLTDFEKYFHAKKMFFTNMPEKSFLLSNKDDAYGEKICDSAKARKFYYSINENVDFSAKIISDEFAGMTLKINDDTINTNFTGRFNAYNILTIYSTAILCGFSKEEIISTIPNLFPVEGRFDSIKSKNGVFAIIDYAHSPDALENVLTTIKEIRDRKNVGDIITVVGCGGNRDKSKRPKMAKIACELSDKVIFTSDNPRSEDPQTIINEMMAGINNEEKTKVNQILNRQDAIRTAYLLAKENDIILIAGKGHEKYQDINGTKYHFDDKEIINNYFNEL